MVVAAEVYTVRDLDHVTESWFAGCVSCVEFSYRMHALEISIHSLLVCVCVFFPGTCFFTFLKLFTLFLKMFPSSFPPLY